MRILILGAAALSLTISPANSTAKPGSADALNAQSIPAPVTIIMRSPNPGMSDAIITRYRGNVDAVPPAKTKAYPLCTPMLQDDCQNRGEGGEPVRSRAIETWALKGGSAV